MKGKTRTILRVAGGLVFVILIFSAALLIPYGSLMLIQLIFDKLPRPYAVTAIILFFIILTAITAISKIYEGGASMRSILGRFLKSEPLLYPRVF